jgi:heme exporter protein C
MWWKALSVLLIFYTIIVGMIVPLKPAIQTVKPDNAKTGTDLALSVTGYNTSLLDANAQPIRAWLKLDEKHAILAQNIDIQANTQAKINFKIPQHLPTTIKVATATLLIDTPNDGAFVLPNAVFLTQDSIAAQPEAWSQAPITALHNKAQMTFPYRNVLGETIRNLYFHVPLWFGMMFIFLASAVYSVLYLRKFDVNYDLKVQALTSVGILYGVLGLITGAVWAKHTWGAYWSWDVKQNMAAVAMLVYCAYFVLRGSFDDMEKSARLSAVYNIFAFAALPALLFVIPRLTDSLHPGNGGNPGFGGQDLDNTMRLVFYPAIIGFTMFGFWMAELVFRYQRLKNTVLEQ